MEQETHQTESKRLLKDLWRGRIDLNEYCKTVNATRKLHCAYSFVDVDCTGSTDFMLIGHFDEIKFLCRNCNESHLHELKKLSMHLSLLPDVVLDDNRLMEAFVCPDTNKGCWSRNPASRCSGRGEMIHIYMRLDETTNDVGLCRYCSWSLQESPGLLASLKLVVTSYQYSESMFGVILRKLL